MAITESSVARWRWNPRVACRVVEDNAFILLDSRMVSLNEVGTTVWTAFERTATLDDAVQAVATAFDVEESVARADAEAFVHELVTRQMLIQGS
ncbi:MAG: PqqD family protein [Myxococcota bacterium]